ncbi:MAG TPA: hypothetical protein DCX95_07855 [Elusimicrobia bacterium]|nr:hypothetical protein [Elusimicrobiota bacterium]
MDILKKGRRRQIFVKRSLQLKYLGFILMTIVIIMLPILWGLYYKTTTSIVEMNHPRVLAIITNLNKTLLVDVAIVSIIILAVAVFLSHKVAGPIYRFEKSTGIIGDGDLTFRVHLRKYDELKELENCFNNMVLQLQDKIKKENQLVKDINISLTRMSRTPDIPKYISKELVEITESMKKINSGFRVNSAEDPELFENKIEEAK